MLDKFRSFALGASIIIIILGIGAYLMIRMNGGESLLGAREGSLPAVNFSALDYTADQPGYLMCDPAVCPSATPDEAGVAFTVSRQKLRRTLVSFTDNTPTIRTLRMDIIHNQFDFTERLPGESFPSVIAVRILGTPAGDKAETASLALYSYSPMGSVTSPDHKARLQRWVRMIKARLNSPD